MTVCASAEPHAQTLATDVVDHSLGDQEPGEIGQTPGRERQAMLDGGGLDELVDLSAYGHVRDAVGVGSEMSRRSVYPSWAGQGRTGTPSYRPDVRDFLAVPRFKPPGAECVEDPAAQLVGHFGPGPCSGARSGR